jgi:hypothetical protein
MGGIVAYFFCNMKISSMHRANRRNGRGGLTSTGWTIASSKKSPYILHNMAHENKQKKFR